MTVRSGIYLILDILLLAFLVSQVSSLLARARLPFDAAGRGDTLRVTELIDRHSAGTLEAGDIILSWKGHTMSDPATLSFLSDFEEIGASTDLEYLRGNVTGSADVRMIAYYGIGYVILVLSIGMTCWIVGIYVLLRKPEQLEASVLHWGMMFLCAVVILAWEGITPHQKPFYGSPVIFFVSYIGAAATFFLFTSIFPGRGPGSLGLKVLIIYSLSAVVLLPLVYYHARAVFGTSLADYRTFGKWFDVYHILLFLFIAGAIINFLRSFFAAESAEERKKTKWLMFGFCTGPTPFILLTIVPNLVAPELAVPEIYTLPFLIIIPLTFAISFVRYGLFNVEVVIHRTTVYGLAVFVLLLIYLLAVAGLAGLIGSYATETYAIAAVLVGLLFEPARKRVQHAVDRTFFRVRYNFREAERSYLEEIKHCLSMKQLADLLVRRTDDIIPVERIGFFVLHQPGNRLRTVAQKGFPLFERRSVRFEPEKLATQLRRPVALPERIEPGVDHEIADRGVFSRWHMALVFPMLSEEREFLGFLVLGEKKAGTRFTGEDVDLLRNVAAQAGLAIERIMLQRKLLMREAEVERLAALNELKSDFVSYVSHELRTPLTSIRLFAELLKEREKGIGRKGKQFLNTIEGETDRLNRMVSTILDSAEIEHGVKEFDRQKTDLAAIARRAMTTMAYQLKKNGFEVHARIPRRPVPIVADPDAVQQSIMNLIVNSIKYSDKARWLCITVDIPNGEPTCTVEDHGRGIAEGDAALVFQKFYRASAGGSRKEGVGLGLPLVRHIMEAHNGRVGLRSRPGCGSSFSLVFPPIGKEVS